MKVRFLEIDEKETFLLGYPLKLTPTERRFLLFIAQNEFASADDLIPLLRTDASRGNIAVHICEINKKAHLISGRKLVLFEAGQYKLNPYM